MGSAEMLAESEHWLSQVGKAVVIWLVDLTVAKPSSRLADKFNLMSNKTFKMIINSLVFAVVAHVRLEYRAGCLSDVPKHFKSMLQIECTDSNAFNMSVSH